ncbi:bifunctional (p)ppGpp synthetase/guanosine-3',5'-bis(diphosphate) 3'-pyrophosphohydrolase [Bacillus licheniformis]|nr:bifunctional (p)ppGpp synthetase/guanosine-3',5'-bis(diphosphate) 3'-pyrophosphohydrolase [Bacillus licheniformis]
MEKAKSYLSDEHVAFIKKAYQYAEDAHREQYRKSGEPYIIHPIQVAGILVDLEMDPAHLDAILNKFYTIKSTHKKRVLFFLFIKVFRGRQKPF